MSLTMAELGAFASGLGQRRQTWAEWYARTQGGEFQQGQRVLPRRGETIMRLESAETTAWRRAMAAERAAGVRGPARSSRGPKQFKQRMARQQSQRQRRDTRAQSAWRQRQAARRQKHREKQQARKEARAERRAGQKERAAKARARARAKAAAKRKAAHEAYLKQKGSTHEGYAPRTAFPSTMVSVARYRPAPQPASAWVGGGGRFTSQARSGVSTGRGPLVSTGVSYGMSGLSGLG